MDLSTASMRSILAEVGEHLKVLKKFWIWQTGCFPTILDLFYVGLVDLGSRPHDPAHRDLDVEAVLLVGPQGHLDSPVMVANDFGDLSVHFPSLKNHCELKKLPQTSAFFAVLFYEGHFEKILKKAKFTKILLKWLNLYH